MQCVRLSAGKKGDAVCDLSAGGYGYSVICLQGKGMQINESSMKNTQKRHKIIRTNHEGNKKAQNKHMLYSLTDELCTANTNANVPVPVRNVVTAKEEMKKEKRIQECDKPRSNQNKNGESVAGLPITTRLHKQRRTHTQAHIIICTQCTIIFLE